MNKTELISKISGETGLARRDSEKALNAALRIITEALGADEQVHLVGFGTFEVRERKGHIGHNPATMEPMDILPSRHVSFRAGKGLDDAVKSI